jgi:two-component system, LuxR family, sensor kinase FixL
MIRPRPRGVAWARHNARDMTALRLPLLVLPLQPPLPLLVTFVLAYLLLDRVSHVDPLGPLGISPWNPAAGLALFLLLRYGLRYIPWLFVAALLAQLLSGGRAAAWPILVGTSALIAAGYGGISALLTQRLQFRSDLNTLRAVTRFVAVSVVGTLLIALSCIALYSVSGTLSQEMFARAAAQFWIGDLIGVIVVTPVLLIATRTRQSPGDLPHAETALQVLAIVVALVVIFGSGVGDELKLFYLLFIPQIWIAMRRGVAGTAWATLLVQVGLIAALLLGGHAPGQVLDFQFLMLTLALTGLFLGVSLDERRAAEAALRTKQFELDRSLRAAAASELASTLAHELNQPLSALASYSRACQLLLESGDPEQELTPTLNKVVAEANRAATVVRRLREFVLTGMVRRERLTVAGLLEGAARAAQARAQRHGILVSVVLPGPLPMVQGDSVQLETVLHNLIGNAIDALRAEYEPRVIRLEATLSAADVVQIAVADEGPGIHPDIADTLFQPLASTKAQGLGLGLAISRTLVEAHGGRLWLEATRRGARFCLTLPVVKAEALTTPPTP